MYQPKMDDEAACLCIPPPLSSTTTFHHKPIHPSPTLPPTTAATSLPTKDETTNKPTTASQWPASSAINSPRPPPFRLILLKPACRRRAIELHRRHSPINLGVNLRVFDGAAFERILRNATQQSTIGKGDAGEGQIECTNTGAK